MHHLTHGPMVKLAPGRRCYLSDPSGYHNQLGCCLSLFSMSCAHCWVNNQASLQICHGTSLHTHTYALAAATSDVCKTGRLHLQGR